ncbi:C-C motif chemokine 28 isoform X2 [Rana temporaria]|uniref:C-C motif chemokine 28 isoform X2 n=1 Tax=Rana temporaria TaxID=8407 RepID=UPI001AAC9039|nr:C-C motif chemokine 28 isoform X2 [Rana temporaria]
MTALRLASSFLCLLCLTEAFSAFSSSCCTELGERISKNTLKKVIRYKIQRRDGLCHLQAFVLYTKEKTLCVSPKSKRVRTWIAKKVNVKSPSKLNHSLKKKKKTNQRKNRRKIIKKNKQN